jgi:hypothetical protein
MNLYSILSPLVSPKYWQDNEACENTFIGNGIINSQFDLQGVF